MAHPMNLYLTKWEKQSLIVCIIEAKEVNPCKVKGRGSGGLTLFIKMMKSIRGKAIFLLVVISAACIAFEHRWYIAGAIILIAGALSLLRGKVLW